jgi:hypothetical protein
MMGHVTPLYNDVRSKGEQFLREQFVKADLGITPKPKFTDREVVEALLRGKGYDPARIIRDGAFAEPHRLVVTAQDIEKYELKQLTSAFSETMFREFIDSVPASLAPARASPGLPALTLGKYHS